MYRCFECGYTKFKPFRICLNCKGTIILNFYEYFMEDEDE